MNNGEDEEKLTLLDEAIASGNPSTMLDSLVRIRADLAERGVCRWIVRAKGESVTECGTWFVLVPGNRTQFCPSCGGQIVTEDKGDE